jgi:hypothetical protein
MAEVDRPVRWSEPPSATGSSPNSHQEPVSELAIKHKEVSMKNFHDSSVS